MLRARNILVALSVAACLPRAAARAEEKADGDTLHPHLKVSTSLGDFTLELDGEKAPISTINFIQYAEDGFYDGTIFHRVMSNFMIQGGGFLPSLDQKSEGLRAPIKNEWRNGLKNVKGSIAMARLGRKPDSATAQFFINVVDNPFLDEPRDGAAYAVFGKVVDGMDVVDRIRYTKVDTSPKYGGGRQSVVPVEPVIIKSIKVEGSWNRKTVEAKVKEAAEAEQKEKEARMAEAKKKLTDVIQKAEKETGNKVETTASGLMYADFKVGKGDAPKPTDTVEVNYTGWLTDGTKFDSSYDRGMPATFPLNRVVKGWTEGISSMKPGGKRRLIIPPDLGYGESGRPPKIPGGAYLIFDVELLSVK